MTAIEKIFDEVNNMPSIDLAYEDCIFDVLEIISRNKEMERNQIIRAVNYSEMNREELKKQAIEERKSIGEVYYDKMIKDGK